MHHGSSAKSAPHFFLKMDFTDVTTCCLTNNNASPQLSSLRLYIYQPPFFFLVCRAKPSCSPRESTTSTALSRAMSQNLTTLRVWRSRRRSIKFDGCLSRMRHTSSSPPMVSFAMKSDGTENNFLDIASRQGKFLLPLGRLTSHRQCLRSGFQWA